MNAPRLWLKLLLAVSPRRGGGRPAPLGTDGWRAASCGTRPPPRAQTALLCERPTEKKGRTRRPAPRAPTRLLRALRRACPARSDALARCAPTAHTQRATRASGAFSAHSRDARHASPLSHSLCDRYLVPGWAPFVSNHKGLQTSSRHFREVFKRSAMRPRDIFKAFSDRLHSVSRAQKASSRCFCGF